MVVVLAMEPDEVARHRTNKGGSACNALRRLRIVWVLPCACLRRRVGPLVPNALHSGDEPSLHVCSCAVRLDLDQLYGVLAYVVHVPPDLAPQVRMNVR